MSLNTPPSHKPLISATLPISKEKEYVNRRFSSLRIFLERGVGREKAFFERFIVPRLPTAEELGIPPIVDRLGSLLGSRKMGLSSRTAGLVGEQHVYSFDLKSTTDRWPLLLLLLFEVMQYCFDTSFASSVVLSVLGYNIFEVPLVQTPRTGVPRPRLCFEKYGVFGDDVVIADQKGVRFDSRPFFGLLQISSRFSSFLTIFQGAGCESQLEEPLSGSPVDYPYLQGVFPGRK
ncbi:hypothetical protein M9H77_30891 [Catharanthus roseus]|uniref:Uncharacterized protein n=1 Tax=Catharanthus roseus TaxID=4058 RepID=A0ACB9ZZC4_CATRO|nr:hypothetical protein M9H77_30891 [Catharanthus roseus]